jgi:hypothetical protein
MRSSNPIFTTVAQEAMQSCANINQMKLSPANLAGCCFPLEIINVVLNKEIGEIMEYQQIMISPRYTNIYKNP